MFGTSTAAAAAGAARGILGAIPTGGGLGPAPELLPRAPSFPPAREAAFAARAASGSLDWYGETRGEADAAASSAAALAMSGTGFPPPSTSGVSGGAAAGDGGGLVAARVIDVDERCRRMAAHLFRVLSLHIDVHHTDTSALLHHRLDTTSDLVSSTLLAEAMGSARLRDDSAQLRALLEAAISRMHRPAPLADATNTASTAPALQLHAQTAYGHARNGPAPAAAAGASAPPAAHYGSGAGVDTGSFFSEELRTIAAQRRQREQLFARWSFLLEDHAHAPAATAAQNPPGSPTRAAALPSWPGAATSGLLARPQPQAQPASSQAQAQAQAQSSARIPPLRGVGAAPTPGAHGRQAEWSRQEVRQLDLSNLDLGSGGVGGGAGADSGIADALDGDLFEARELPPSPYRHRVPSGRRV